MSEASRGKYTILGELGRGGMGIVLLARDAELERQVAIKVLAPALVHEEDVSVKRFRREARIVASLRHESIVSVYDVGLAGEYHFFVMDFIDGVSLARILRRHGPLPIPVVETFLLQVGSALAYAHQPGRAVIHRDVKPSNIMVDPEGLAVVTDFGISKATQASEGLTRTGHAIGTAEYMSPEQIRGIVVPQSDQYSLGAVVFAMLTGAPPFTGPFHQVLVAHQEREPPRVLDLRPDCPEPLAVAVERMLAKEPRDRWPSLRDPLRALDLRAPLAGDEVLDTIRALVEQARDMARGGEPDAAPSRPTGVEVEPIPADLEVGDRLNLHATLLFADGHQEPPPRVEWRSTDPAVLRVDSDTGELVAVGAGAAKVEAWASGLSRSIEVSVEAPSVAEIVLDPGELTLEVGEEARVRAEPRTRQGDALDRGVLWSSSNPRTVSVSETGEVTARRVGMVSLMAHCEGVGSSLVVRVERAAVRRVEVTGLPEEVFVGETHRLEAMPLNARDAVLDRPVTWSSSDPDVVRVSAAGVLEARSVGVATVTASCEGRKTPLRIEVAPMPVASLAVDSPPDRLAEGDRGTFRALVWDREGRVLSGRQVTWESENPTRLRVEADGSYEALEKGAAEVVAVCEGRSARASVRITGSPAASIRVSAPEDALLVGDTFHLEAEVVDRRGGTVEGSPEWAVDDSGVLEAVGPGLFRAVGAGTTDIRVTFEGVVERVTVQVVEEVVEGVVGGVVEEVAAEAALAPPRPTPRRTPATPFAWPAAGWSRRRMIGIALMILVFGVGLVWWSPWSGGDAGNGLAGPADTRLTADDGDPLDAPRVVSVEVVRASDGSPVGPTLSLVEEAVERLEGMPRGGDGEAVAEAEVVWTSSAPTVADVDRDGVLRAVGEGSARVTASSGEASYGFDVRVDALEPPTPAPDGGPAPTPEDVTPPVDTRPGILQLRFGRQFAIVTIDGEVQDPGGSRFVVDTLPPGPHVIRAEWPDFEAIEETIVIEPGETLTLTWTLRRGGGR